MISVFVVQHIETGLYLKGKPFAYYAQEEYEKVTSYARIRYMTPHSQKARWFKHKGHATQALQGFDMTKFQIVELS
jgi:hypothetical protein